MSTIRKAPPSTVRAPKLEGAVPSKIATTKTEGAAKSTSTKDTGATTEQAKIAGPASKTAVDSLVKVKGPGAEKSALTSGPTKIADRPIEKKNAKYDYIIVGAGAGGAPLAARLAEEGKKVLVLEAGVDKKVKESEVPAFHGVASEHKDLAYDGKGYFTHHYSDVADEKKDNKYVDSEKGVFYPRGTGFGGSTRMNANIFVRVDDVDWERIAEATGDPSWRAPEMKEWLQKLEKNEYRPVLKFLHNLGKRTGIDALQNRRGHGFDGWLETTRADPKLLLEDKQLLRIVYETTKFSFTELGGLGDKLNRIFSAFDPNDDRTQGTEGLVLTPLSVTKDGRRNGPRDRLLDVAEKKPENLTLQSGAKVSEVLFDDNNEAIGVRYTDKDGKEHTEYTGREVVLSAGAFETPALLLRSGIGPKEELKKLEAAGVKPRVALEGVGQSLSDRYEVGVVTRLKKPFDSLNGLGFKPDMNDPAYKKWEETGKGLYGSNGVVIAMQAKSDPSLDEPDLYVFGVPGKFDGYYPGYSGDATKGGDTFTWLILHENKGDKKGVVSVDPNSPNGQPNINFQYHKEENAPNDSKPLVDGVKLVRQLMAKYDDLIEEEIWPGSDVKSDEDLKNIVEANSWGHHANGTTKMGHPSDNEAVVDPNFKVYGTKGLRIVDASTFPDNPGSFIASAIMQQSERAAGDMLADAAKDEISNAATYNKLSILMDAKPANIDDARKTTKTVADDAKAAGMITKKQHADLTDGTVSKVDSEMAWSVIEDSLKGDVLGSDPHTRAHNLLLAVNRQLEKQGKWETRHENMVDKITDTIGLR